MKTVLPREQDRRVHGNIPEMISKLPRTLHALDLCEGWVGGWGLIARNLDAVAFPTWEGGEALVCWFDEAGSRDLWVMKPKRVFWPGTKMTWAGQAGYTTMKYGRD